MFWGSKKISILGKKIMNFKHELSPSKPFLRSTQSLILGTTPLKV
jgi:hypothetical protein